MGQRGLHRNLLQHRDVDGCCGTLGRSGSLEPHLKGSESAFGRERGRLIDVFPTWDPGAEHDPRCALGDGAVDNELLGAEDDEAQFTDLYRVARAPVRRYLQRMVGVAEADDLTADVFTTVWSRWPSVPPEPDRRYAWVFGVAHFKVQEVIRTRQRGLGLLRRLTGRRTEAAVPGPEDGVLALQRARDILALLPSSERDAVALTVLGGLSSAAAGQALGCSVSAVTSRVSRARRRLQDALSTDEEVHRDT